MDRAPRAGDKLGPFAIAPILNPNHNLTRNPNPHAQAVVNETVDDEATRAELLAAMASTESVADLLGSSLAAKDQQLSSLQGVLQVPAGRRSDHALHHGRPCTPSWRDRDGSS